MNANRQIKIGAILSYATIFFNIITGLLYTPWMIRSIGNSDYGLFTLAMSLINTFTIDLGLGIAVQKYVSRYLAEKNQKKVDQTVGIVFKLYLTITLVLTFVFLILYFFIGKIYPELSVAEIKKFKGLYLIAVINCIVTFPFIPLDGLLHSYERFIESKICGFIHKAISIILTVTALLFGMGVYSLVMANLISGILFVVIRLMVIRRKTNLKPNLSYKNRQYCKDLLLFSMWSSVSVIAIRFILSLQPSVLGMVAGTEEIAVFGYAVSLESYIYLFVNAINGFFMPTLTRISQGNNEQKNQEVVTLMVTVGRFILLLYGLMFIGFFALGKEFISLLLGSGYADSYYCTILICAYGLVAYPQQIANTYIVVKNKVKKRAIVSIFVLAFCMIGSVILGDIYGAIGVSVSIFVSLIIYTIMMNRIYKNDLGIDIGTFFKKCHIKMLPGLLLHFGASLLIAKLPLSGWGGFCIKTALIGGTYIVIGWFMLLNQKEKNMIKNVLKKKP